MPLSEMPPTLAHAHAPFPGSDLSSRLVVNVFLPSELGIFREWHSIAKTIFFKDQVEMESSVSFCSDVLMERKIRWPKDHLGGWICVSQCVGEIQTWFCVFVFLYLPGASTVQT